MAAPSIDSSESNEDSKFYQEVTLILKDQSASLGRLEFAILGDNEAGIDGYGKRIQKLERYQSNDKKFRWIERLGIAGLLSYFGLSS